MGELREAHFHAGLDIKTNGGEGLPVYAAADGYISRIKVSEGGYGKVLYITHGNNQTSVYAHLSIFTEELEELALNTQYSRKSYYINIYPKKDRFKVKKGQLIGRSGNTGSSRAPHLHFEIRDPNHRPMNPIKFGFEEVVDNLSPVVFNIAIQPLDINARANGAFEKLIIVPKKLKDGSYVIEDSISAIGLIGVEVQTHDRAEMTYNRYGVNRMEVLLDGKSIYSHEIDQIAFNKNKYIHAFTDFSHRQRKNQTFQRCYIADGNVLNIYPDPSKKGKINVEEDKKHSVTLLLYDSFNNKTEVRLNIVGKSNILQLKKEELPKVDIALDPPFYDIYENTIRFQFPKNLEKRKAKLYSGFFVEEIKASYEKDSKVYFLWDLREGIPDSISYSDLSIKLDIATKIPSDREYIYNGDNLTLKFKQNSLLDTLYLSHSFLDDSTFFIGEKYTPFFKPVEVEVKPKLIPNPSLGVYLIDEDTTYLESQWKKNKITFSTTSFGRFTILNDTVPPDISIIRNDKYNLKFKVVDNLSGIGTYEATLNGEWVLLFYEPKYDHLSLGELPKEMVRKGKLVLKMTDKAGNETTVEIDI